jgi:hypothetical protein
MTEQEVNELATQLLATYGDRGFQISMPDETSLGQMATALTRMGHQTVPGADPLLLRVFGTADAPFSVRAPTLN